MTTLYPQFFARFYDLIYSHIRSGVDTDYFLKKISEANGPVLEVGTGTGRFFIEALNQGADIYGIDISPSMLDILRSRIDKKDQHRISLQSITGFTLDKKFALVIAPFRVFMHLTTVQEQIAALNHVYDYLEEGGLFIFDLFVPNPGLLERGMNEVTDFEGENAPGETVRRITSSHSDIVNQITHVTFRFEWSEKGKVQSETWNTELRLFFRYELEHLLTMSKFTDFRIFGDYHERPLTIGSKDFLVVCLR
ncbi:MAG: class I SAM-dependent methyltransferase [Bacteroidetes bacterium]|nr:class I SAM-dependent methyltransferase [Bacteroidota bacterium]